MMKPYNIKYFVSLFIIMLIILSSGAHVLAKTDGLSENINQKLDEKIETEQLKKFNELQEKLIEEASEAYEDVIAAHDALENKNKAEALKALERASGKFNVLIGRNPEMALLPIEANVTVVETDANIEEIKAIRSEVESLVSKGHLQAARRLLNQLSSEVRYTIVHLPMEIYPDAIRKISGLIEKDKLFAAQRQIELLLSAVVVYEQSLPIPIIKAQALVSEASAINLSNVVGQDNKENTSKSLKYLEYAREELKFAEELGYGKKDPEFAQIRADIREVETKIKQGEKVDSLFEQIKTKLQGLKNKITRKRHEVQSSQ